MRAYYSFFKKKNSKKGLSLSTVLVVCIVLALMVAMLVSMASLNINTTQASVSQREAYIQAKSAIAFAESYYKKNGKKIPGAGGVGEGLVVFNTENIAGGATFYTTKEGTTQKIDDATIQQLKDDCASTYIEVTNGKTTANRYVLNLNAVTKYGDGQAYSLAKEFRIEGSSNLEDKAFTGAINYQTSSKTRYVRFHVRATSALGAAPYFYMWYNQVSPPEFDANGNKNASYNSYATSSIVNKLTFNQAYGKVQNGSWGDNGPEGSCAMSYEGGGWYVTQKTFNLDRNLNFVNGIITKTGSTRSKGNDQQSWEFFGIPIPEKVDSQLGEANGVDVYFEINRSKLRDMQWKNGKDEFSKLYTSFGGSGIEQLNEFVKYCGSWYTVYTKTDTAIVHFRDKGVTNNDIQPAAQFRYEGYGWWRDTSHNFNASIEGVSYGSGRIISQNKFGKEIIRELYVCRDGSKIASFGTEEEANEWFVKQGDIGAGDYVEINVKGSGQPVDAEVTTQITYSADFYKKDTDVPTPPTDVSGSGIAAGNEELTTTDLDGRDEELKYQDVIHAEDGAFFLVGSMNNWQEGEKWANMKDQLSKSDEGQIYFIDYDVEPATQIEFKIVQRPDNLYDDQWGNVHYTDAHPDFQLYNSVSVYVQNGTDWWGNPNYSRFSYTNYWGGSIATNYNYVCKPESNCVRIFFDAATGNVTEVRDIGDVIVKNKKYSVVGWMNDWGKKASDGSTTEQALYENTNDMSLFANSDGKMVYSDGSLIINSGVEYRFKVVERDAEVDTGVINWAEDVYGKEGVQTDVDGEDEETSVLIKKVDNNDSEVHKYMVSIIYDPATHTPDFDLIELNDKENFYVIGDINGWSDETADSFKLEQAANYQLEESSADTDSIKYTYRIRNLLEGNQTYNFKVVSSFAQKDDGTLNYDQTWGSELEGSEDHVTQGADKAVKSFTTSGRCYLIVNFEYFPKNPEKSIITFTPVGATDIDDVASVYVGFFNNKLLNTNDPTKNSKFENKWDTVYVTYYTELTGSNCFECRQKDGGDDWWVKVPEDAEYVYFSNKKTHIYNELHSESFEYTAQIPNAEFKNSAGAIFFPINYTPDEENRKCWSVGDSKDFNTYINKLDTKSGTENMAYYGSTHCNYYDAPIVNVLNMLVTGDPRPTDGKYIFSAADYTSYNYGGVNFNFSTAPTVSFQGEEYHYCEQSVNASSVLIVQNVYNKGWGQKNGGNKNGATMTGYLYEGDMSLQRNNTTISGTYVSDKEDDDNPGYLKNIYRGGGGVPTDDQFFYMNDRAGGVFVSDEKYRNGKLSLFNYGGYTPNWYTFRVPAYSEVTISKVTGCLSDTEEMLTSSDAFKVVKESQNVNRPIYFFKDANSKIKSYTYNIDQGVVDTMPQLDDRGEPTGDATAYVYFENTDSWSNVCVYAYNALGEKFFKKLGKDGTNADADLYVFDFDEGAFSFFQFYEAEQVFVDNSNPNAAKQKNLEALENAEKDGKASKILYYTGLELNQTTDQYLSTYAGMDGRTTMTLCRGAASSLDWYMHPRTAVMHAYLDLDSVVQMTTDTKYYTYNQKQGTYGCHDEVQMRGLASGKSDLEDDYRDGNAGSHIWTAVGLSNVGDGLLEAASEFMETVSEARIYVSDDVSKCPKDNTSWSGTDPDKCMVFMEGEQLQNSAFKYTERWLAQLKNTYKKIMLDKYTLEDEDGNVIATSSNNGACIWTNTGLQNAAQLRQYTADLRLWLDNPQMQLKPEAVRIIVDDTGIGKNITGSPWGLDGINLWVKRPGTSEEDPGEWLAYSQADRCTTTQSNFYAFVFMFPREYADGSANPYWNCEFTIAKSQPDATTNRVGGPTGIVAPTLTMDPGHQYRFNTVYFGIDDEKTFSEDTSVETKLFTSDNVIEGANSPTSGLNEITSLRKDGEFDLNFKYDTRVRGGGLTYTIYAGVYRINAETYPGFYSDFGGSSVTEVEDTGINLYSSTAKTFFTTPSNYGMAAATGYSDWKVNKINSDKNMAAVDVMTGNITKADSISATGISQPVNFRYNNSKGSTLTVKQDITLSGSEVTIAVNTIDFKGTDKDFILNAKKITFLTDTTIKRPDGTSAIIEHGTYQFREDSGAKLKKISLRSTNNSGHDWRDDFDVVNGLGTDLKGGRYVAN